MNMKSIKTFALLGAAALLASFAGSVGAQRPTASQETRPRMGGMMGRMGHMGRPMMGAGRIVGNKNTKVYHMPGDNGNMPAEKNRVYFRSEREAMAAGYHASRARQAPKRGMMGMPRRSGMMGRPGMMGGQPTSSGGHMNGHLPK